MDTQGLGGNCSSTTPISRQVSQPVNFYEGQKVSHSTSIGV